MQSFKQTADLFNRMIHTCHRQWFEEFLLVNGPVHFSFAFQQRDDLQIHVREEGHQDVRTRTAELGRCKWTRILTSQHAFQLEQAAYETTMQRFQEREIHENSLEHSVFRVCLALDADDKATINKHVSVDVCSIAMLILGLADVFSDMSRQCRHISIRYVHLICLNVSKRQSLVCTADILPGKSHNMRRHVFDEFTFLSTNKTTICSFFALGSICLRMANYVVIQRNQAFS